MTQLGIESATFRFVAQHLNHCTTAVRMVSGLVIWLISPSVSDSEERVE